MIILGRVPRTIRVPSQNVIFLSYCRGTKRPPWLLCLPSGPLWMIWRETSRTRHAHRTPLRHWTSRFVLKIESTLFDKCLITLINTGLGGLNLGAYFRLDVYCYSLLSCCRIFFSTHSNDYIQCFILQETRPDSSLKCIIPLKWHIMLTFHCCLKCSLSINTWLLSYRTTCTHFFVLELFVRRRWLLSSPKVR